MKNFKLTIEMLPKGAWNNDFSKTLPKKNGTLLEMLAIKKQIIDVKFAIMKQTI